MFYRKRLEKLSKSKCLPLRNRVSNVDENGLRERSFAFGIEGSHFDDVVTEAGQFLKNILKLCHINTSLEERGIVSLKSPKAKPLLFLKQAYLLSIRMLTARGYLGHTPRIVARIFSIGDSISDLVRVPILSIRYSPGQLQAARVVRTRLD